MEQKDKPWVVNYPEAVNRTCDAIYKEYKTLIELFNKKICDACSNKKREISYRTDNETTFHDLYYFYTNIGFKVETDEKPDYKNGIEYTIYKLKLMW
jgi:hypothetical protein